jgi:hypothetical protein
VDVSSTEQQHDDRPASKNDGGSRGWSCLVAVVLAGAASGVVVALTLPLALESVEWPQFVSKQWVERLQKQPQPPSAPTPTIDESMIEPVEPSETGEAPAVDGEPRADVQPERTDEPDPQPTDEASPPPPDDESEPAPPSEPGQKRPIDVTYKVDRRAISKLIRSPSDLGNHGRFVPNTVDGQRRGFKFADVAAGGLFDRLGVREGDVVLEVNGRALTTQSKLIEDIQKLRSAHVYVVRIQRDDTTRIHRYDAGPPLKRRAPGAEAESLGDAGQ